MTRPPTNILFLAAGRRVSLVRQFKAALTDLGDAGRVITEDATPSAPAHVVSDTQAALPRCTVPGYIDQLMDLCGREQVRLIVPLIDTVLPVLSPHREAFTKAGITALVSAPETAAIGHHKGHTGEFFRAHGFKTPRILSDAEIGALKPGDFPLFVKPPMGSSSIGAEKVSSLSDLTYLRGRTPDLMVMELVTGDEYTVDVYVDLTGIPRCAVPRRRLEVRAGEVSKGLTVRDETIIAQSLAVAAKLPGAIGCITLQCFKRGNGDVCFIEINARFGGGYPLSWHAGASYPKWLIQEVRGDRPGWRDGIAWRDNLAMLRYDDELIIDGAKL
jgi:carbamoyl-phosphate synthase large subunit